MSEIQNSKIYDLEERTFKFAKRCRIFIKRTPRTIGNLEDCKQLVRSSGSVHANFIEANESLSRKDFYHRAKICRKEVKESRSWLNLVDTGGDESLEKERKELVQEATELMKIFGSMIDKENKK